MHFDLSSSPNEYSFDSSQFVCYQFKLHFIDLSNKYLIFSGSNDGHGNDLNLKKNGAPIIGKKMREMAAQIPGDDAHRVLTIKSRVLLLHRREKEEKGGAGTMCD